MCLPVNQVNKQKVNNDSRVQRPPLALRLKQNFRFCFNYSSADSFLFSCPKLLLSFTVQFVPTFGLQVLFEMHKPNCWMKQGRRGSVHFKVFGVGSHLLVKQKLLGDYAAPLGGLQSYRVKWYEKVENKNLDRH